MGFFEKYSLHKIKKVKSKYICLSLELELKINYNITKNTDIGQIQAEL